MLVAFPVLALSACATSEKIAELQKEPGYISGYADGCQSATEAEKSFSTKRVRDDISFKEDEAYRVGWRAGLLQCDYRQDDFTSQGGIILGEDANRNR